MSSVDKLHNRAQRAFQANDSIPAVLDEKGNDLTRPAREHARRNIELKLTSSSTAIDGLQNLDPFKKFFTRLILFIEVSKAEYEMNSTVKTFESQSKQAKLRGIKDTKQTMAQDLVQVGPPDSYFELDFDEV
ncbi:hypothetical protein H0H93_011857 [Arthromyces matolae]|nr:hypothetical protein H0H93_011857 [Arthromyces matolae]